MGHRVARARARRCRMPALYRTVQYIVQLCTVLYATLKPYRLTGGYRPNRTATAAPVPVGRGSELRVGLPRYTCIEVATQAQSYITTAVEGSVLRCTCRLGLPALWRLSSTPRAARLARRVRSSTFCSHDRSTRPPSKLRQGTARSHLLWRNHSTLTFAVSPRRVRT